MRIENLIENNNLLSSSDGSRTSIFESIGHGDVYFTTWEKEIHPILCEVALTPDQIQQLFTAVEKGSDRTLLGKVKDAPGKISDVAFWVKVRMPENRRYRTVPARTVPNAVMVVVPEMVR